MSVSGPPRLVARVTSFRRARKAKASARAPRTPIDSIPPTRSSGAPRPRGRDPTPAPGSTRARSPGALAKNSREPARVLDVPAHAVRQRADAAQHAASSRTATARRRPRSECSRTRAKNSSASRAMTTPPRTSLWPPRYFVVECITRSAPSSSGRCSIGVAHVLSTTSRAPARRAIAAAAAMSVDVQPRVRRRLDPDEPGRGAHGGARWPPDRSCRRTSSCRPHRAK